MVLEGYSPLKSGRVDDPVLVEIAERHGKSPAQVVLRWHLEHEICIIPKSTHRDRIEANIDIFDFRLGADEVEAIDGLADTRRR